MNTKRKNASLSALESVIAREVSPQEVRDGSSQVSPTPESAAASQKKKIQLPTYPPARSMNSCAGWPSRSALASMP